MLEARNISFSYGINSVLQDISLSIAPTERVSLEAPSGFGKTTLCQILAGYVKPQQGSVLLDGNALPKKGMCPVQMIWQHPEKAVDPRLRMRDILSEAGPVSEKLLQRFGIQQRWLSRYPHELSGGELQRFCIVRALTAKPRFLIADEISTMLDAVTQVQIWEALLEEVADHSIGMVLVTHSQALSKRVATRTYSLI